MGQVVHETRTRLVAAAVLATSLLTLTACNPPAAQNTEPTAEQAVERSADELNKSLEQFSKDRPGAKVVSDAQLRKGIPQAQQWLENVEIKPSKCGVTFAAPITEQLKNSVMGAVELKDQYITVAIYPDVETLKTAWDAQAEASNSCARYTVKSEGQSRAFHLAEQPVKSYAELNQGYVITGSDGTRTSQQLSVRSASANVLVGIQQATTKEQTADQLKAATETVNAVLEKIN